MKLLFLLACICFIQSTFAQGKIVSSRDEIVKKIDIEARRELLFLIVERINSTVIAQPYLAAECISLINATVENCTQCQNTLCSGAVPVQKDIVDRINKVMKYPIVVAGKGVERIGKWFGTSTEWMGKRAGEFSKTVGGVAKTVGRTLADTGDTALDFLGNTFSGLGDKLLSTGDTIISEIKNSIDVITLPDQVKDMRSSLQNVWNDIDSGLSNFVSNAGKEISSAAKTIWSNTLGRIFRRKRSLVLRQKRCSECPVCTALTTETNTPDQIARTICGGDSTMKRISIVEEMAFLQDLYNKTVDGNLITEITFDTSSIDFSGGSAAFAISNFTINLVQTEFKGIFDPSKHEDMGKAMAQQYFATLRPPK